jgi:hypothetical protein
MILKCPVCYEIIEYVGEEKVKGLLYLHQSPNKLSHCSVGGKEAEMIKVTKYV